LKMQVLQRFSGSTGHLASRMAVNSGHFGPSLGGAGRVLSSELVVTSGLVVFASFEAPVGADDTTTANAKTAKQAMSR
jgi:hypothetical protein